MQRTAGQLPGGKTYEQTGYCMYQLNGSLEQSFQIRAAGGKFSLSLGRELKGDSGYLGAIESTGPFSIRTKDGKIHPILEKLTWERHKKTGG